MIPRLASHRGTAAIWRRRIIAAFTERLLLKATAVLLAILLWVIVGAREKMEMPVPVSFQPQLDSSLVLRDERVPIRALVLGTPSELLKLETNPPVIRRTIAADAPDTLVLDLQPQDVEVPNGIDADVEDVRPRSITLRFEPTSTKRVPVRANLQVIADPTFGPVELRFDPASVEVSGPRLALLRITSVPTVRTTLPFDSLPHLVELDTAHLGARVKPPQVKVKIIPLEPRPPAIPRAESGARLDSTARKP